jgi:type I restriction enzyme S subunit
MQTDCFPEATADWTKAPISFVAAVNPRYPVKKGQTYPFVEMASVGENFLGILAVDWRKLDSSGLSRFKVRDTLFAKITPCPENGKVAFVGTLPDDVGLGSTEFIVLSPLSDTNPRFLFHLACSHEVRGRAVARMEGSTGRQRVPEEVFTKRLLVPVPTLDEQSSIAGVLDVADAALVATRAAIDYIRKLRLGLLQDAFEFAHSHERRKVTDLGDIPESWDVIKGKEAFRIVTGGCSSVEPLQPLRGAIPNAWFMKVDDFNSPLNSRVIKQTKIGFKAEDNQIYKLHDPGTLIIAKRGVAISKNRVRATSVPVALDPNLMALRVLPGMRPEFLRCQLEWRNLSRYVENSGVPQLNNKDLYPRLFLRAPDDQQKQIIQLNSAVEAYEDAQIARCEAIEALKKALMSDLLCGRIRVKEAPEAAAA